MPVADHTRASDTEHERVALRLASAASVGRLTVEELEDRTDAALKATTRGELSAPLHDLPDAPRMDERRVRRLPWLPGANDVLGPLAIRRGPADLESA